jgi:hypothetical protein
MMDIPNIFLSLCIFVGQQSIVERWRVMPVEKSDKSNSFQVTVVSSVLDFKFTRAFATIFITSKILSTNSLIKKGDKSNTFQVTVVSSLLDFKFTRAFATIFIASKILSINSLIKKK